MADNDIGKLTEKIKELENKLAEKEKASFASEKEAKDVLQQQMEQLEFIKKQKNDIADSDKIIADLETKSYNTHVVYFNLLQKEYLQLLDKQKFLKKEGKELTGDEKERLKILKDKTFEEGRQLENLQKEKKQKEEIKKIGSEILEFAKQNTLELEKHIMNISKLNGGSAEFGEKLREANLQIYQATAGSGIMLQEANAAFAGLSQNFIGLTTQSQDSIAQMVKGTAQLAKLGVDAGSASKGFDSLVNAMGKTSQQAYKIQESFVQMAAKNRLALGAVSQAFAENSSRFVGYGEQMTKVLDGLAEQSLKTGVAISGLVKIAQQFDTFGGAATAVGNLNALLGGDYLNSIELLTASDDERIKLLKDGVAASGMQWESMNRSQKMAVANAAGISDLNEASKIFGQTSLENTRQQADAAAVQKTLAEQAESVSTSMDKMKSVLNSVVIALDPVVSIFGLLVTGLVAAAKYSGEWGEKLGGFYGKVVSILGSLISLTLIYIAKNLLLGKGFGGIIKGMASFIAKVPAYIAAWRAKQAAETVPTPPVPPVPTAGPPAGPGRFMSFVNNIQPGKLLAAAAALVVVSVALFIVAKAVQEFGQTNKEAVTLALVSLAGLVGALIVIDKLKGKLLAGAVALGIMGLSLIAVAYAFNMFNKVDFIKLAAGAGAIAVFAAGITGLGVLFAGPIGAAFLLGVGILLALGVALGVVGIGMKSLGLGLSSLGKGFDELIKVVENLGGMKDNIDTMMTFLKDLADINVDPINNLAAAIGLLAENLMNLSSVSTSMSLNVGGNAKTAINEQINATAAVVSAAATTSAAAPANKQSLIPANQTTVIPMIVQIDGKNFIEIFKKDIEKIAQVVAGNESIKMLDSVGVTQSAFNVQAMVNREGK